MTKDPFHTFLTTFILTLAVSAAWADEKVPKLPDTVSVPNPITMSCITNAKTLPAVEVCRGSAELAREITEEYSARIVRFCDSLLRFDGKLRSKAQAGHLKWSVYEDLKDEIRAQLDECDPKKGDYYAPYRARMLEYRQIMDQIQKRRESIVRGIGL